MCGIVGILGNIDIKEEQMFRDMLVFDAVRGFDSTGVLKVDKLLKHTVAKEVGLPDNLFKKSSMFLTSKGTLKGNAKILLGHNRAATKGEVTKDNAHPFELDKIVGVKNGSLHTFYNLHNPTNHPVDSYALFSHLEKHGVKEAWGEKRGPAAISWWDKGTNKLNFLRNAGRPLYYMKSKDEKTMFFSSEVNFIVMAAFRAKIKLKMKSKGNSPIFWEFSEDIHYEVDADKMSVKKSEEIKPANYTVKGGVGTDNLNRNINWTMSKHIRSSMEAKGHRYESITSRHKKAWSQKRGLMQSSSSKNNSVIYLDKKGNETDLKDPMVNGFKTGYWATNVNLGWAFGTEKSPKSIKENLFRVERYRFSGEGNDCSCFFEGSFVNSSVKLPIQVYPVKQEQLAQLAKWAKEGTVLKSSSRLRLALRNGQYRVAFAHVYPATKRLPEVDYIEDEISLFKQRDKLFNVYQQMNVSEDTWHNYMKGINYSCSCCGTSLVPEEAGKYTWFKRDVCLCENCSEDNYITGYFYGIGV